MVFHKILKYGLYEHSFESIPGYEKTRILGYWLTTLSEKTSYEKLYTFVQMIKTVKTSDQHTYLQTNLWLPNHNPIPRLSTDIQPGSKVSHVFSFTLPNKFIAFPSECTPPPFTKKKRNLWPSSISLTHKTRVNLYVLTLDSNFFTFVL